jgi:hypothetical protein
VDVILYSTPPSATITLTLDSGEILEGEPCVANERQDAHRFTLPDDLPIQGALVEVWCEGFIASRARGIVRLVDGAYAFLHDDFHLEPVPPPPEPPPPPNPHQDPFAIICAVNAQGAYDLATKEGCGEYTHASCEALHAQHSAMWGHIRKTPPSNMWDGHAVDAVMLLAKAGTTDAGIYDIILDTESPNAQPAWSYKGPPDPNLWMDPAEVV